MLASACVRHNNSGYSRSRYELENKRVIVSVHELLIVAIFLFGFVAETDCSSHFQESQLLARHLLKGYNA